MFYHVRLSANAGTKRMTTLGVMRLVPLRLKLSESVPEMENI